MTAQTPGVTVQGARHIIGRSTAVLTVNAGGAYAAGQLIGGLLTFPDLVQQKSDEAILLGAELSDASKQDVPLDLMLFDDNPANTTFTDAAAFNLVAADLGKHVDTIQFLTTSYADAQSRSVAALRKLVIPILLKTGTILYGALISRGAPTYAGAADLTLKLWGLRL